MSLVNALTGATNPIIGREVLILDNIWCIGDRVKEARAAADLSQDELGEKIGVKRQTIGKWESGDTYPDTENLEKLCIAFDCDLAYLLGEIKQRRRITADVSEVTGLSEDAVEYLSKLNRNAQNLVTWRLDDDTNKTPLDNPFQQEIDVINALLEDAMSNAPDSPAALRNLFVYVLRSLPDAEYYEIVSENEHLGSFSRGEMEDASLYTGVMLAVKLFKQKFTAERQSERQSAPVGGGDG